MANAIVANYDIFKTIFQGREVNAILLTDAENHPDKGKIICRTHLPSGKYIIWVQMRAIYNMRDREKEVMHIQVNLTKESNNQLIHKHQHRFLKPKHGNEGQMKDWLCFHTEYQSDSSESVVLKFWSQENGQCWASDMKITAINVEGVEVTNGFQSRNQFLQISILSRIWSFFKGLFGK